MFWAIALPTSGVQGSLMDWGHRAILTLNPKPFVLEALKETTCKSVTSHELRACHGAHLRLSHQGASPTSRGAISLRVQGPK